MRKKDSKMRQRSFGTAMGVTSIIAILVILVLVVFSTLSLITARADLNLSRKTADNIDAYYTADGYAEMISAQFGELINSGESSDLNLDSLPQLSEVFAKGLDYEYNNNESGRLFSFTVSVDESRQLNAEVLYNDKGEITKRPLWQISPVNEWKEDNDIRLFEPN